MFLMKKLMIHNGILMENITIYDKVSIEFLLFLAGCNFLNIATFC